MMMRKDPFLPVERSLKEINSRIPRVPNYTP
jgi:hypothetical protein